MTISILTLFPEMFKGPFEHSIIKRAQDSQRVTINYVNIRDFGIGKHKLVDDTPFGGGAGMLMRVDVVHSAILAAKKGHEHEKQRTILLAATGTTYSQKKAKALAAYDHLIFICGHYEGIDERITNYVDDVLSIGDFITTGGEIPTMLMVDSIVRLLPGAIREGATDTESFSLQDAHHHRLLEYPQYTQPRVYDTNEVPNVLLSGNHAEITKWRKEKAGEKTIRVRPDLLKDTI